jgi:transcriptional regulator with XRE-family HTH domain
VSQAGNLIRQARRRSRLSQRELARRSGTSQAAISRIESGQEEPTVERLEQILAGLGWRPVIELEPIEIHDEDPRRLYADVAGDPSVRLESGLNLIEFSKEFRGAAERAKSAA